MASDERAFEEALVALGGLINQRKRADGSNWGDAFALMNEYVRVCHWIMPQSMRNVPRGMPVAPQRARAIVGKFGDPECVARGSGRAPLSHAPNCPASVPPRAIPSPRLRRIPSAVANSSRGQAPLPYACGAFHQSGT